MITYTISVYIYMKIIFDHITGFGKITSSDFIHVDFYAIKEDSDSTKEMMENGWLPWDGKWFQLRSTRYKISETMFNKKKLKKIKDIIYTTTKLKKNEYEKIIAEYIKRKNFISDHCINNEELFNSTINYYYQEKLIGFVCYLFLENSFIGLQFFWNYENPSLSLGNISTYLEIEMAKKLNCEYYYMMGGYEKSCIYKMNTSGFEWWTGKVWSKDKKMYEKLCERDSLIEVKNYNDNI